MSCFSAYWSCCVNWSWPVQMQVYIIISNYQQNLREGWHLAPMKVKFGMEEQVGWLFVPKFTLRVRIGPINCEKEKFGDFLHPLHILSKYLGCLGVTMVSYAQQVWINKAIYCSWYNFRKLWAGHSGKTTDWIWKSNSDWKQYRSALSPWTVRWQSSSLRW